VHEWQDSCSARRELRDGTALRRKQPLTAIDHLPCLGLTQLPLQVRYLRLPVGLVLDARPAAVLKLLGRRALKAQQRVLGLLRTARV
jgi:hypothetical protein